MASSMALKRLAIGSTVSISLAYQPLIALAFGLTWDEEEADFIVSFLTVPTGNKEPGQNLLFNAPSL